MGNVASVISIQPGQIGEGMEYNVRKPLPYPIHVDDENRCENVPWPGCALAREEGFRPRLIGFQATVEPDPIGLLLVSEWRDDPERAVGMFPVFTTEDGGMANLVTPITDVNTYGGES